MPLVWSTFRHRFAHFRSIAKWWWWVVATAWSVLFGVDAVVQKWASTAHKTSWNALTEHLPFGNWQLWLIGLLLLTLIMLFEGSFRHHRDLLTQHQAEIAAINDKLKYPQINLSIADAVVEWRQPCFECFLLVRAHNLTPDVVTRIAEFKCELQLGDAFYASSYPQDDVRHFERVLFSFKLDDKGNTVQLEQYELQPGNLCELLQRGIDKIGWVHFSIDLPMEVLFPGLARAMEHRAQSPVPMAQPAAQDVTRIRLSVKDNFDKWHSTERDYRWTENDGVRAKRRL
jgi:hypothetical protein